VYICIREPLETLFLGLWWAILALKGCIFEWILGNAFGLPVKTYYDLGPAANTKLACCILVGKKMLSMLAARLIIILQVC